METVTGVLGNLMDALGTITTTVTSNAILYWHCRDCGRNWYFLV